MTWDSIFTIDMQVVVTTEIKKSTTHYCGRDQVVGVYRLVVACVRPQCIVVVTQRDSGVHALYCAL
jgi:hypothetical protein